MDNKKDNKAPAKAGRKKVELNLELVRYYASRGLNQRQIAKMLGVSEWTILRRKRDEANFANAMAEGRASALAEISNSLYSSAKNGSVQAQQFFLKNMGEEGQWSDKEEQLKVEFNLSNILEDAKARVVLANDRQTNKTIEGESLDISELVDAKQVIK